jgi:hypothetical protein
LLNKCQKESLNTAVLKSNKGWVYKYPKRGKKKKSQRQAQKAWKMQLTDQMTTKKIRIHLYRFLPTAISTCGGNNISKCFVLFVLYLY